MPYQVKVFYAFGILALLGALFEPESALGLVALGVCSIATGAFEHGKSSKED